MPTHHADIWVIGSGAAGLRAAIAAGNAGASVCVLGKEAPGKGTATERSGGALAGAWAGLSQAEQSSRTLTSGRGINRPELVEILAAEGPDRFQELIDWGLPHRETKGALRALAPDGELGDWPKWSTLLTQCLAARAGEAGVSFMDPVRVTEIQAGEDGVRLTAHGAEPMELLGGAVVLAAGGAGALYEHHDNPPGLTGSAHALALNAGAELQDMEFLQFYPMTLAEPGKARILIEPDEQGQGRLHNDKGEDILEKYGITEHPASRHARDSLSQAMFREMEHEGHEIFIDLTGLDRQAWLDHNLAPTRFGFLDERYGAFENPLRIAPVAHFSVGGVRIGTECQTSIAGLYAAGEAAGGVHGANRMGGNSLAETIVFGHRAGLAAAACAQGKDQGRAMTGGPPPAQAKIDDAPLFSDLSRIMWRYGGILRDADGLAQGLEGVARIGAQAERQGMTELSLAVQTAELIMEGGRRREESRGVHFRTDFPETDDGNWLGNMVVVKGGRGLDWRFDPI